MQPVIDELILADVGKVLAQEPMANHTTWKVGGPADIFIEPENKPGLIRCLKILHARRIPWRMVGKGSNLLVRDRGIRGAVIKLSRGFDYLHIFEPYIHVGGGYPFVRLANMIGKQGLTGFEFAGGIPGTVGGAVYMNAGAHGSEVSQVLTSAEILFENGELMILSKDEMNFSYRTSILQEKRGVVTEAAFRLAAGDRKKIAVSMAAFKDRRRRTQPLSMACAGSVFRNPEGDHAGRLIESAGLKGYRLGGAQVSEIHANFIVNLNQATAKDILLLMEHIQKTVKEKYGVELVPEVQVVGEG